MIFKDRTIVVSPQYAHLHDFIKELPVHFDREGVLIRSERNTVKIFSTQSLELNAKEFCVPPIFYNRIAYCFLRLPKAVKAYNNAIRLKELGFETPTPIAYMLFRRGLLLSKCYFISEQYAHSQSITDIEQAPLDESISKILHAFGLFTAKLHNAGIYHGDYGNGNILINYEDGNPIFSLIDINRMRFGTISHQQGCREFCRLCFSAEKFEIITRAYAQARGIDYHTTLSQILSSREAFKRQRKLKQEKLYKIKSLFFRSHNHK